MRTVPERRRATLTLQARFLAAYATGFPTAKSAAKKAKIARSSHIRWLVNDPKYAERFDQLRQERVEEFEAEAARRAVEGVSRIVLHAGVPVRLTKNSQPLRVTEYSDTLLMFILKAERPEKYRDRREVRHSGDVNEWAEIIKRSRELSESTNLVSNGECSAGA